MFMKQYQRSTSKFVLNSSNKEKKSKSYDRSFFSDWNKTTASFIFTQFRDNFKNKKELISWLKPTLSQNQYPSLTKWFLSIPQKKRRSQQIIKLAFVHDYRYHPKQGTKIPLFKSANEAFTKFLQLQNNPSIGIKIINQQRALNREILRLTPYRDLQYFVGIRNSPGLNIAKTTKRKISNSQKEKLYQKLKKFLEQLIKQPNFQTVQDSKNDDESIYSQPLEVYDSDACEDFDQMCEQVRQRQNGRIDSLSPLINYSLLIQKPAKQQEIDFIFFSTPPQTPQNPFRILLSNDSFEMPQFFNFFEYNIDA